MSDHRSPRVNKARMADFKGQTVRLIAKIINFRDDVAIVEASDGGEVEVKMLKDVKIDAPYMEVIGQVVDERTIKMMGCVQLGLNVDMKLANDVVEVWHDPKFASMF
ncbi:replication factor A protein 3 [Trametes versicolor FP-101664 SS1]|uniref:replication factor A protein 3 n=1 Tax=Trametes versicolor (strain FP-101664) TaxID=717944 RepID=UPI00046226F3|nr:replication factor A protein 3 [Trametes versicolor FP-101664 SS1]EIW55301.1 replication factor A protein 3 [Trametes versicolor FP-101664 SS1]